MSTYSRYALSYGKHVVDSDLPVEQYNMDQKLVIQDGYQPDTVISYLEFLHWEPDSKGRRSRNLWLGRVDTLTNEVEHIFQCRIPESRAYILADLMLACSEFPDCLVRVGKAIDALNDIQELEDAALKVVSK